MNVSSEIPGGGSQAPPCVNAHPLRSGLDSLDAFLEERRGLEAALENLASVGDETSAKLSRRLRHQLDTLEPSITMIGQVKAGKTSLVNAMVGWPGLLPADVNPWTSVVTSLHLDPEPLAPDATQVSFRFFDQSEWDRLLDKGGRIGELAERAGHGDELEKVRRQIEHMREKSRSRLGRRFEMLLGQQHDYGTFDEELIERYVCLGDDFDDDDAGNDSQGRFADITKSAQVNLHRPEFPMKLCIRDTPGVNDTFMMREQITIRAIRDSRICVVVLSAHQALSSVDMALIRLISNIRSREVVIFVNRIDELSDPSTQIPEIRESIRDTLKAHNGPVDAEIVFGSAHWANTALSDTVDLLEPDSAAALLNWAEGELKIDENPDDLVATVWELSGVPALYRALAARIAEGVGREAISRAARSAVNLAKGVQASGGISTDGLGGRLVMAREDLVAELDRIAKESLGILDESMTEQAENYNVRLDRSHRSFLERATASLVGHLDKHGEKEVWQYEPTGLRLLLRSAYQVFGSRSQGAARKVYKATADELSDLYARAIEIADEPIRVAPPDAAHIAPPVVIGQTIALDLQSNWWRNWWRRRRGYHAFATEFYSMIEAETRPLVSELKTTQVEAVRADMRAVLETFLDEQRQILLGLADRKAAERDDGVLELTARDRVRSTVEDTLAALNAYAA